MLWEAWHEVYTKVVLLHAQKSSDCFELQLLRQPEWSEHVPWCDIPQRGCVQVMQVRHMWGFSGLQLLWVPERVPETYVVQVKLGCLAGLEKQECNSEKSIKTCLAAEDIVFLSSSVLNFT